MLLLIPLAPIYVSLGGHEPELQRLETVYLRTMVFSALPSLVNAAIGGFFSARGAPWVVLLINGIGTLINGVLDYVLIFGKFGAPELGVEGAGWATVAGAWVSALVGFSLILQPSFRRTYNTLRGWWPERDLFLRLLRFGGPAGLQMFLDILAFTFFTLLVGQLGANTAAAVSIAITFNLLAFLPMHGMGQAVAILVGRRLGEDRADLAEQSTIVGFRWAISYMTVVGIFLVAFPEPLVELFRTNADLNQSNETLAADWAEVAAIIPRLLILIAIYSIADAANIVYASALRGAGDTKFVTWVTFGMAWPLMVLPTWLCIEMGGSIYLAWGFASLYIIAIAFCFWFRFRSGIWKSMRVIESETLPEHEITPEKELATIAGSVAGAEVER
jgi:MATE family multidrug resistance protein